MAEFRIASGYVEISTKLDKSQIHAAAREAAAEFDAASTGQYDKAGQHAGHDFATGVLATHDLLTKSMHDSGTRAGEEFTRGAGDRIRDERGRFAKVGEDLGDTIATGTERTFLGAARDIASGFGSRLSDAFSNSGLGDQISSIGSGLGKVGSFAQSAAMPMAILVGTIAGLEIGPPILFAIGGGLASIPALATGAVAGIGALELGLQGVGAAIGEVFNPKGGGGGAANRMDQIASAERNLASAERNEREAQQALTEARIQAAFHLEDLNLQMERQQENERGAALAIQEAQQALMQAQATGDPLAIMRAQLGLQEAVTGLKEQQQQTVELAHTKADADAKGVEGSDQVVAALDRVQNSTNAVIDAQNAVKQASISAAAGAVTAYSKLSPEAKKFVDEIARLKPELIGVQQYVQDKLFVGLDRKLDTWAHVWLPAARRDLGGIATDFNHLFSRLGDDLSKPEVVAAVDKVTGAFGRVLDRFTTGGTLDKLVTGFTNLVTIATPFIEGLADSAIDKLGGFADSLNRAAKDGSLERFFKEAAKDARDLWDIGQDVFGIISDIISVVFGEDTKLNDGKNGLDRLKDTLDSIKKWAESEKGKQTIKDIADTLMEIGKAIEFVIVWVARLIQWFDEGLHETRSDLRSLKEGFFELRDGAVLAFQGLVDKVTGAIGMILTAADEGFSWVPGLGSKLDNSKKDFDRWVRSVNSSLDGLRSPRVISVELAAEMTNRINSPGSFGHPNRWGGVYYADQGLISLGRGAAGIYSGGPLYGFAEPDTGGELFMPRNGEPSRNQDLARIAAHWAGMVAVPARSPIATGMGMTGGSTSGQPSTLQPVHIHVGGEPLVDLMIGVVKGNPVVVSATAAEGDRVRRFTNSGRK